MERREVLKLLASAAVFPAFSPEAFSLFREVHAQIAEAPGLKTLNPQQDATVTTIVDLIIPETDTPGAKGVKVNEFIDLILSDWFDEADTSRFLAGLADVDEQSQRRFGKTFTSCSQSEQTELLKTLDEEAILVAKQEKGLRRTVDSGGPASTNFFLMMKRLTLTGYYTSEVGFEEELHKFIIPPTHAGCAPLPAEAAS